MKSRLTLLLSLVVLAVASSGCNTSIGTRTTPKGDVLTIKNTRFIWSSQNAVFKYMDGDVVIELSASKSGTDVQAIEALSSAVNSLAAATAKGAVQGLK